MLAGTAARAGALCGAACVRTAAALREAGIFESGCAAQATTPANINSIRISNVVRCLQPMVKSRKAAVGRDDGRRAAEHFGCYSDRVATDGDQRFSILFDRLALVWLGASAMAGLGLTVLGTVLWPIEWAVALGVGSLALVWGFLGTLSLISAAGATRLEQAVATRAIQRRVRAGDAEPTRAALSLVPSNDAGTLSDPQA